MCVSGHAHNPAALAGGCRHFRPYVTPASKSGERISAYFLIWFYKEMSFMQMRSVYEFVLLLCVSVPPSPRDFLAVFNLIWEMGTDLKDNPVLTHTMQNLELIRRHLPLLGINLST